MTKPLTERFDLERFRVDVLESRERMALTQKQLAETVGISKVTLRAIESGTAKQPQAVTLEKLCEALGLSLGDYAVTKETPEEVPDSVPEEVATDQAEARLTELEAAHAEVKRLTSQLEDMKEENARLWSNIKTMWTKKDKSGNVQAQLEDAQTEIRQLREALDIKNGSIQKEVRRADGLQSELDEDDRLILYLIDFVKRLKDGDVRR